MRLRQFLATRALRTPRDCSKLFLCVVGAGILYTSPEVVAEPDTTAWSLLAGDPGSVPENRNDMLTQARKPARGKLDAAGPAARFYGLGNMTIDSAGNLYVLDQYDTTVRKIAPNGSVSTVAELPEVESDITEGARAGIAVDKNGNVFVSEPMLNRIIEISEQRALRVFAGSKHAGKRNGPVTSARFAGPRGLAFDKSGNLYVADTGNCAIRRISADGAVTTVAGGIPGLVDGPITSARFEGPSSLAIDDAGNIYVAENVPVDDEGRAEVATALRRIGIDGQVTTLGENAYANRRLYRRLGAHMPGDWFDASTESTAPIVIDAKAQLLWASDGFPTGLQIIDASGPDAFNEPSESGVEDNPRLPSLLSVGGIAVDGHNNVYVADTELDAIYSAKLHSAGRP